MKLLIVCSSGGHLAQMWALKPFWEKHERVWVTLPTDDAVARLVGETVVEAHYPTVRSLRNLVRNTFLAHEVLCLVRPDVILSTGAAAAVPFFAQAGAFGAVTVHLEPVDRIRRLSLSGRLLYPFADHFFVQWPELAAQLPESEHVGVVL
ncbi:glycosyltransferase family protein [Ornithinimicrobium sediminis]|uniref:UDP-N-acetylglucosamine--LPS N-acetylglucosamine transferase n=1 Tax=Ornithinimicrobium sediminis TaxID=2904603 RepID=UPI001E58609E|nr:UDP-N-acetylglucosamine--LPS N-acetylglucosamine transferase [Ornithinimicrobium sediminis]